MTRFLVLIYEDEQKWIEQAEQTQDAMTQHVAFAEKRRASILAGEGLQPTTTATSVRHVDGLPTVTDGPFVETKEALGGFYLIEADDLDAATTLAQEIPSPFGGLEIRPVMLVG